MNLNSSYDFKLDGYQFYILIDWSFNLLYLKNYTLRHQLYIDASFRLVLDGTIYPLGNEQNFGCLLDLISCLEQDFEGLIFESHIATVSKKSTSLIINSNKLNFSQVIINNVKKNTLKDIKIEIIKDFNTVAKNIDFLTELMS